MASVHWSNIRIHASKTKDEFNFIPFYITPLMIAGIISLLKICINIAELKKYISSSISLFLYKICTTRNFKIDKES